MKFSIVTPSYNQPDWLDLCLRSVADQRQEAPECAVEHLVQDGGSADIARVRPRAEPGYALQIFSEPDSGMYDAINRGFRRASGDICAYLNCDEQYLPGALGTVAQYFTSHPEVDVVFADAVVTDENGHYLCSRLAQTPFRDQLWFRMPVLSCATFVRRRALEEHRLFLDTSRKIAADVFWVMAMQNAGLKMSTLRFFTSIFTETSENLGLGGKADAEFLDIRGMMPAHVRRLLPWYLLFHRVRSVVSGVYFQKPFEYALYTRKDPHNRERHHVAQPTQIWKSRLDVDRQALAAETRRTAPKN